MSCVVALEQDGVIWMGGDSLASCEDGNSVFSIKTPKIYDINPYIVGVCGSPLAMNSVQFHLDLPPPPKKNLMKFVSKTLIPKITKCVQERSGITGKLPSSSQILIGVRGRLISIDSNTQHYEPRDNYHAIGSGSQLAKGCLCGLELNLPELPPEVKIKSALIAAEKFSNGVAKPWTILHGAQE